MKRNQLIFSWHQWCGLAVAFFLLFMSISGAILVFSDEYEEAADAPWMKVDNGAGRFSYDASLPRVRAQYSGWELRAYGQPRANKALVYELRKGDLRKRVYVHPVSGRLLHVSEQARWYQQLLLFHNSYFSGTSGKFVVLCVGLLFLATLLTGFYVYRRSVVKVLLLRVRLNRKNRRSYHSSLHRIVGVWALAFNLLIVSAGLMLAGEELFEGEGGTPAGETVASTAIHSVDGLRTAVLRAHPDFDVHMLFVPPAGGTVQFAGRYRNDPFYYGDYYSSFTLNGQTGEEVSKVVLRDEPLAERLVSISNPLHFGNWGGVVVKILYCLLGLTPALLSFTGFMIWMRTPQKKHSHPPAARKQPAVRQSH